MKSRWALAALVLRSISGPCDVIGIRLPQRVSNTLGDGGVDRQVSPRGDEATDLGFWPPWPFSLLKRQESDSTSHNPLDSSHPVGVSQRRRSPPLPLVMSTAFSVSKKSLRIAVRNFQELGSQIWYHLPPAAPPLLVLAAVWPRSESAATSGAKRLPILLQNRFCRNCAGTGVALALISWGHTQWFRKRLLTPIPPNVDINRAVLPPFLPAAVPVELLIMEDNQDTLNQTSSRLDLMPPRLRRYWKHALQESSANRSVERTTLQSSWLRWSSAWQRSLSLRRAERNNARRLAIYDELIALQQLKRRRRHSVNPTGNEEDPGYALVTGASQGIGRAIAVELARWEIPLILVARNTVALKELAEDLENCYGVSCYVVGADLSHPDAAAKVYETVRRAKLHVDILVNNAGIATHGDVLDHSMEQIDRVLQVNTLSLIGLTHLFGKDMKRQRRGRILMVSSICGAVSGISSVAVYSATKAFENSFGVALGREMEPYGVGVTCLLPGAVRDTEFRERSQSSEALCWKVPFYAKSASTVAECGVRSLLLGETQATPGLLNRIFLKVLQPVFPQRLHNLIAEVMWNPVRLPWKATSPNYVKKGLLIEQEPLVKEQISSGRSRTTVGSPDRVLRLVLPDPEADLSQQTSPVDDADEPSSTVLDAIVSENQLSLNKTATVDSPPPIESRTSATNSSVQSEIPKASSSTTNEEEKFVDFPSTADTTTKKLVAQPPPSPSPQKAPPVKANSPEHERPNNPAQPIQTAPVDPSTSPSSTLDSHKPKVSSLEMLLNQYQRGRLSPLGDPMAPYFGGG